MSHDALSSSAPSLPSLSPAPRGHWVWPLALIVTIFIASSSSDVSAPDIINIDKLGHFLVFGLLGTLVARTQPRHRWWWGFAFASLYGLADEWRQSFTPGRHMDVADWVADTLGAALAVTLYARWHFYRRLLETNLRGRRREPVAKPAAAVSPRAA